ncbi:UDP-N-acetylmuramoyl-tripeptide--D-alanyl-D-alanine ligase [Treponema brennaborense]|uniref:UDP-N-acetylmuramoyl-tripeptide--D-alanyl-D-alanine ligase n=1 Tax=Treponema brennaborense (strain DSM 12168 / CIP 105900 / DD5/3) TaxID=906968 RepID=F4LJJ0_TREBD|nr:UDP-N-acetylmuramoyl-tripeptide--D-alanyl-D-alanine ligase [Treponema brennaborense]AEE16385.1 UDP-N-acetylmuramoylalanyl-D-glutamyl-2,6-diamin opimelate/D-alanyl-D-alanyl ligase [Treponema brennaborense DSM 12168]
MSIESAAATRTSESSLLSFRETIEAVAGKYVCLAGAAERFHFTNVTTDSRTVTDGSLFVPLVGETQDGHKYILQALEQGARVVFADLESYECLAGLFMDFLENYPDAVFIVVKNTLTALQCAAAAYVKKFPDLIKIGITGSSGKTTTKELIAAVLSRKYTVVMNEGNLNSETGLPLSVFKIRAEHEVGIFEMGMNRKGEIAELANVLCPRFAVVTNIGSAHIGILGSKDAIAYEKKQIFSRFTADCVAFIPAADPYADFLAENCGGTVVRYGVNTDPVSRIKNAGLAGTEFLYRQVPILLPLPGAGNFSDALAAASLASYMGFGADDIKAGLESVRPLFGRSQIIGGPVSVVQDCYNANPDSMEQALDFFASLDIEPGRKIAVLGDMLELGAESESAHVAAVRSAAASGAVLLVCIGRAVSAAAERLVREDRVGSVRVECFADSSDAVISDAAALLCGFLRRGDVVLLKGSRGMRLERLTPYLTECAV